MIDDPFASASAYRSKGWVGTLPLPYGKKTAPPKGFTGEAGEWPSTADVHAWTESGPQNIALRLPPNVIALDVDDPKGFLTLLELLGPLPPTWRSQGNPQRLGHLYYRLPAGVTSNGWGAPCPGVDLLRFDHRYSVVAPSVHDDPKKCAACRESGPHGYTWASPEIGLPGCTDLPGPGDLPELPAAWVDYLSGEGAAEVVVERTVGNDDVLTIGHPIPAGTHQETLFRYACSLRTRGLPEEEAAALVRLRAAKDCKPPWAGPDDPWDAVKHAYVRYEAGAPLDAPWPAYDAAVAALAEAPASSTAAIPESWPWVDWFDLWSQPEDEEWVLRPFIPARRAVALYSAPKLGKSLLLLEIAAAISRGTPALGVTPERRPVLYVDFENDMRGDIRRRLRTMGLSPADLGNLRYLSFPSIAALDTPTGGLQLLNAAQSAEAAVVVIDTVGRTIQGEENANDTWLAFYRNTGRLLKEAGIAYVRLDHSGKDDTKGMRGGSAKSSDVDAVWQLTKTGPDELLLYCEAPRMHIPEEERAIGLRRVTDPFLRHERIAAPTKLNADLITQCAIDLALDDAGIVDDPLAAGMTIRALTEACATAGVKNTNKAGFGTLLRTVLSARKNRPNAFYQPPEYAPEHLAAARQMLGMERRSA